MKKLMFIVAFALSFVGCGKPEPKPPVRPPVTLERGEFDFVFTGYTPLASKPVKVYYYIPSTGDLSTMPILFAMHGADRNAPYQINSWRDIAEDKQVMVFAPEFTKELYPSLAYQMGGVSTSSSSYAAVPQEKWTYNILESMFDYIKLAVHGSQQTYDLWGHSAGGQWTHRFMFYMKTARVRMAVESNAGNYTVPTLDGISDGTYTYGYPFSLKYTTFTWDDVRQYLAKPLVVHLGTNDLVSSSAQDSAFPDDPGSCAEGATRFARGHFFYDTALAIATERGWEFNWTLKEVSGIGHNSYGMVRSGTNAASVLLYGDR